MFKMQTLEGERRTEQIFQTIMAALESRPEISQQEIARIVGTSSGNISGCFDRINLRLFEENHPKQIRVRYEGQSAIWRLAPRYYRDRGTMRLTNSAAIEITDEKGDQLDPIHLGNLILK